MSNGIQLGFERLVAGAGFPNKKKPKTENRKPPEKGVVSGCLTCECTKYCFFDANYGHIVLVQGLLQGH